MLKNEVKLNEHYLAKVGNDLTVVKLDATNRFGGWEATNVATGRTVRIKSAAKLRRHVSEQEAKPYKDKRLKRDGKRRERVHPAHDWFVMVKIKPPNEDIGGQTALEQYAQDVADSVYPVEDYENTYVVFNDGAGHYVRPHWAQTHEVT